MLDKDRLTAGGLMSISSQPSVATGEAVLRAVPKRTTEAWERNDAGAFADAFTTDTKVVIAGTYLQGRDQVYAYMSKAFAGPIKGTRVVSDPVSVEYMNAHTGLVMTEGGILLPGEAAVSAERAIWSTWVLAQENGQWCIRAYHSSPIRKG